jgi:ATP-dependent RNA helicase DHX57
LDKRGQEEKCPHCDRTFKQSGRLKDHIARQHAAGAGGGDGGASAGDAGAGPSSSGSGGAVLAAKPPRPGAAAAAAATAGSGSKPPSRAGSSGTLSVAGGGDGAAPGALGARPGSAGPAASGSGGGGGGGKIMMDVGARGGYFDEKSPKLLLQEWCTRNKRPRARYVTQGGGGSGRGGSGGGLGCKVVLPDPKGVAERDIVVFLDSSLAAPEGEEAQQRGAVAALHAVQGDRALDYVLPARYRMVWRELCDKVGAVGGGGPGGVARGGAL